MLDCLAPDILTGVVFPEDKRARSLLNVMCSQSGSEYMPANASMQGTFIPPYTQVPATNISVEESAVQQPVPIGTPTEHTAYSYQHNK